MDEDRGMKRKKRERKEKGKRKRKKRGRKEEEKRKKRGRREIYLNLEAPFHELVRSS